MLSHWKALLVSLVLLSGLCLPCAAVEVLVDGAALEGDLSARVVDGSTYVSLRALTQRLRPGAQISWDGAALVRDSDLTLSAAPGACYIEANGRSLYVPSGVLAEAGRVLVPVRTLAQALGAQVRWDGETGTVHVSSGAAAIVPAASYYKEEELYWLSRIISAESKGESLRGKIAVGNVILNRMKSSEFPNSIYGVIFDDRWGGQFQPVRNGTVYDAPTAESVLAARLCLEGANVVGESLYFFAPALTSDRWIAQNRTFVAVIGAHHFYR